MAEANSYRIMTLFAERGLGILALFFSLSYAISRPAYDNFYSALGLQPEDIGLTQIEMVSRGATVLVLLLVFFGSIILAGITVALLLLNRSRIVQVSALLLWLLIVVAANQTESIAFSLGNDILALVGGVGGVALISTLLLVGRGREISSRIWRGLFRAAPIAGPRMALVALALFGLFVVLDIEDNAAYWAGDHFLTTGQVAWPWSRFLNIRSTSVEVVVRGKDTLKICDGSQEAYLLGRNDNSNYVLLKSVAPPFLGPRVIRLASDDYEVVSHGRIGATPCGYFSSERSRNPPNP